MERAGSGPRWAPRASVLITVSTSEGHCRAQVPPGREAAAFDRYLRPLRKTEWVVYSKPPFDGPARVLDYLGRYTHRVAISNDRLLAVEDGAVHFRWKGLSPAAPPQDDAPAGRGLLHITLLPG